MNSEWIVTVVPVVVGAFVTMIGGFYAIAKIMLNQATKDREADRAERLEAEKSRKASNAQMAKAFERVATATERAADEAKQRNGHLSDQSIEVAKIANSGLELSRQILGSLNTSADTLAVNTKKVATAVEGVKTTLEHSQEEK